jgi:hypothetical protein
MNKTRIISNQNYYLFIFGETGVWTEGFAFAKQALYHLNHISSPKLLFKDPLNGWQSTVYVGLDTKLCVFKCI